MKKSIIAILAVFLAAALFIGAGSAITIFPNMNLTGPEYNLAANDTLYLIEHPNTVIRIIGNDAGKVYFSDSGLVVGTYTKSIGNTSLSYEVSYPDVDLKVKLYQDNSNGADMNGKTVSLNSGLMFVGTPIIDGYTLNHLSFTTPAGGHTTFLGSNDSVAPTGWNTKHDTFNVTNLLAANVSAGLWKVNAVVKGDSINNKTGKNTLSFTIGTTTNAITADKDTVVRGNSFILTLTGTPSSTVYVSHEKGLKALAGQDKVKSITDNGFTATLGSSGSLTIQMDTTSDTEDKSYKIEANFTGIEPSKESVKVSVVKGKITIESDAESYYIGNKVTLNGINTETKLVYLYIKGSNKDLQEIPADSGLVGAINVNSDNTWKKEFTFANKFDAGTYTVYAVAEKLLTATAGEPYVVFNAEKAYATTSLTLKQPFLSATAASNTIAKGDKIKITGQVEGTPDSLVYYIFGTNYFNYGSIAPEDDGTYSKQFDTAELDLSTGQYFVVIQHPMYDNKFNVRPGDMDATYLKIDNGSALNKYTMSGSKYDIYSFATTNDSKYLLYRDQISNIQTRQTANAAQAVCNLIDEEYVDDIYVKLDFVVSNAYITINSVGDQTQGATFKVSGTTNVAVDEKVVIDVISTKFQAEPKASISAASYLVQTAKVVAGSNGVNTYESTFDGTPLDIDAYTAVATITRASDSLTVSTTFNIVKGAATPVPTTTGTAAPVTPTATATATPTPASPGFGALIALAGLGAVAVLVLRRQ